MVTLAMLSWKTNLFLAVLALAYPTVMYFMDAKKKKAGNEPTQQDNGQKKPEGQKGQDK